MPIVKYYNTKLHTHEMLSMFTKTSVLTHPTLIRASLTQRLKPEVYSFALCKPMTEIKEALYRLMQTVLK